MSSGRASHSHYSYAHTVYFLKLNKMKKIIFIILCLCSHPSFSDNALFNKVKEKLATDQITFGQFQYLGQLHCLDRYLRNDDKDNFHMSYIELDYYLFPITRLFSRDGLDNIFTDLEKNHPKAQRDNKQRMNFNNYINICKSEFSAEKLSDLYKKLSLIHI